MSVTTCKNHSPPKEFWLKIPFKRTIIGKERSMPNSTVIWFITNNEYTEIRRCLDKVGEASK